MPVPLVRLEVAHLRLAQAEDVLDRRRDGGELGVRPFEGRAHAPDDLGVVDANGRQVNARLRKVQFRQ